MSGILLLLVGCNGALGDPPLFELMSPEATGVTFANELNETPDLNVITYLNYYNGGGVAVGDIDGDGRPDLYFTSNLGSDRLYRNLGDFRFEDITEQAGVGGVTGWKSGVAMADVNGDGALDIYVSTVSHLNVSGQNVLFVNNGDGTFTDRTAEFGLEHVGYSTQAAFLDYDRDGDLDMYLLNHSTHAVRGNTWNPERRERNPLAGDRLFRNDGGRFVDVSERAGIYGAAGGYGLGVVVSDLDGDGWPDVYVANDFDENDFLYLNNGDGTFTESIAAATGHTSRSSMGVDAADYNNDGRADVAVLDMLPDRQNILKTSYNHDDFSVHHMKVRAGYHPQYARNTLQLNRGGGRFSEIGYLAGIEATDWSWAPLFADLDNDGHKDLFITNGIYRRPNDLDYVGHVANRSVQAMLQEGFTEEQLTDLLERMPSVPIPNTAYRNDGDLRFTNVAEEWGLGQPGFSTGAAYVDLNDDGWLDLVVNNVNAPAGIYRNRAGEMTGNHSLTVLLRGAAGNTSGVGAKVLVRYDGRTQMVEQSPTRGFQSSVDHRLHIGLGPATEIDTLTVIWPDQRSQTLTGVPADQFIALSQDDADGRWTPEKGTTSDRLFDDVTDGMSPDYRHAENTFFDYNREPLIPHQLSREGPALAVGDVNGDDLDDVYVGGAKWQGGRLLIQQEDGSFRSGSQSTFQADSLAEDVDAAFVDADGDGDVDLYVVSGGNEFWGEAEALLDRLYVNDGAGAFRRVRDALPDFFENGGTVVPGDFNADGHIDLVVGGRVVSRNYGMEPRSYLLQNDGTGRFTDVTDVRAPELREVGMVSAGARFDYDGDGDADLVLVGEWMAVRVFRQESDRLVDATAETGFAETSGWWNSVMAADLRGTGRPDLILGNLGLNSYIRGSHEQPVKLYLGDFGRDGTLDQILTVFRHGVSYPLEGRDVMIEAIPALRERFPSYASFGAARIEDIVPSSELRDAQVRAAEMFASVVALNNGDGTFTIDTLPSESQFAPIYASVADDFDGDGFTDLLVGGNNHGVPPIRGRYDAGYGLLLRGDGSGSFRPLDLVQSGVILDGEIRALGQLRSAGGGRLIVAARTGDRLQMLRRRPARHLAND